MEEGISLSVAIYMCRGILSIVNANPASNLGCDQLQNMTVSDVDICHSPVSIHSKVLFGGYYCILFGGYYCICRVVHEV
jgi:hypothetical protein